MTKLASTILDGIHKVVSFSFWFFLSVFLAIRDFRPRRRWLRLMISWGEDLGPPHPGRFNSHFCWGWICIYFLAPWPALRAEIKPQWSHACGCFFENIYGNLLGICFRWFDWILHHTMKTHGSFIFRGYNPYIGGLRPEFFMGFGAQGYNMSILYLYIYIEPTPYDRSSPLNPTVCNGCTKAANSQHLGRADKWRSQKRHGALSEWRIPWS